MQLVHVAFGERDDAHPGKAGALIDVSDILLVARQPVDGLRNDHLKLAGLRILQEHLHAGTDQARARDRMIGIAVDDAPAHALRALLAQADLILDRGVALQVGGIAGVDGGGRHDEGLSLFALPRAGLSVGILAAESHIVSLGGGAGKQLYQLDEQRIRWGGVIPRLFHLPILMTLAHACTVSQARASLPRGILAQNRHRLVGGAGGGGVQHPGGRGRAHRCASTRRMFSRLIRASRRSYEPVMLQSRSYRARWSRPRSWISLRV